MFTNWLADRYSSGDVDMSKFKLSLQQGLKTTQKYKLKINYIGLPWPFRVALGSDSNECPLTLVANLSLLG